MNLKLNFCIALILAAAFAGGCANKKNAGAKGDVLNGVTDVGGTGYSDTSGSTYYGPTTTTTPTTTLPPTAGGGAAAGSTYTIKKGDTLYGIARTVYGDGKQWQRIASANPGLNPNKLSVGQTITIP